MYQSSVDDQLLADLLRYKKSAFQFLYDYYSPALHGSIIELVANKEIAAEVLHEAFITAFKTIDSYDFNNDAVYTWLLHIARRLSFQALRSICAWPEAAELEKISRGMHHVLQKMDKGPRCVIELMYYRGYSKRQIGEVLKIPGHIVDELLKTGMNQLYQFLNKCEL